MALVQVGLSCFVLWPVRAGSPPQHLPLEARCCLASGDCLQLEVADEPEEQRLGMMQRQALPKGRGMWFPFKSARRLRFWMHKTLAPLDMLFVNQGRVIAIEAAVPVCSNLPCRSYGPAQDAEAVLELGSGEAARLGIRVGTELRIEPQPSQSIPQSIRP
ncbi:MAG: DUF192 domain-containing protein [Prochlorococcus sp.]|nr:DUF192 domain-containing protein [Prochlorococcaceae cyanobacterium Fu_MAG_50]